MSGSSGNWNLYVALSTSASQFKGELLGAAGAVKVFGHEVDEVAAKNAAFSKSLSTTALIAGGALVAGVGAGAIANVRLQQSMQNVATISDVVRTHIGAYTQQIIDMSTRVPQSAETLAAGLYDIVSSGFDGAQAMQILEASARSASAGMTDTATASRAIVAVLNAYGLTASHATDVSDILFQTVNKGVVTFEQLANEIGLVVPTAAAAGVSFSEVGSAYAAMTLSGLNASEAATSLNQMMVKILSPSKAMSLALHEVGYNSGAAALQADGLHRVVEKLVQSQGTAADQSFKLFVDIRAARGYMALTAAEGKNYASTFDAINNAVARAGASQRAYAIQSQSDAMQWELIRNQLLAFAMDAAHVVMPVVHALTFGIHAFTELIDALPAPLQQTLAIITAVGGVMLLLYGSVQRVRPALQALSTGFQEAGLSADAASKAVRGVQLALGVVGVALTAATAIYGAYSSSKAEAKQITDDFVAALQQEQQGVAGAGLDALVKKLQGDGSLATFKRQGVDAAEAIAAITGSAKDYQRFINDYNNSSTQLNVIGPNGPAGQSDFLFGDSVATVEKYRSAMVDAKNITSIVSAAQNELTGVNARSTDGWSELVQQVSVTSHGVGSLIPEVKSLGDSLTGIVNPSKALQDSMHKNTSSLSSFMAAMLKQIKAVHDWERNLAVLAARGRQDLVQEFEKLGPSSAGALADATHASEKQLNKLSDLFGQSGMIASDQYKAALSVGLDNLPTIAALAGKKTVAQLAQSFTHGNIQAMLNVLQVLRDALNGLPQQKTIDVILNQYNHVGVPYKPRTSGGLPIFQAEGGMWDGPVRRFATGGYGSDGAYYDRAPQIVSGGANILWGEQSTGWEAYISGDPSHHRRSMAIWEAAGQKLGASPAGAVYGRQAASGSSRPLVVVQQVTRLPERVVLDVGSQEMTAYVRAHAEDVATDIALSQLEFYGGN